MLEHLALENNQIDDIFVHFFILHDHPNTDIGYMYIYIYIYIYISIHLKHAFFYFGTCPSPFLLLMMRHGSSKAIEGTTLLCTLSDHGKRERTGSVLIQKM